MHADRDRETSLWGWLKKAVKELKRKGLCPDVQRIENIVAKGTPDVEGIVGGKSLWCELKVAHPMAGDRWRVKITVDQVRYALRRTKAGGFSWVLVRVCGANWRENKHYLIPGEYSEELLEPISRKRLEELSAADPGSAAIELWETMVGY